MRASEIQAYLQSLRREGPYPEPSVDTFKSGDPEAEVSGISVGWMSYTWALQKAVELGDNLFITHEPTFFDHLDSNPKMFRLEGVRHKRQFLEESGLIVLRCHDVWDQVRDIGIADAWGEMLGLGTAVAGDPYLRVYELPPTPARLLAASVAAQTERYGQPGVQLIGPANKPVRRVGIGTGAITPFFQFIDQFAVDAAICTDDGIDYWRDGGLALDLDIPLIVVNHPVSEEMGMVRLAEHLRTQFPDVPVHYLPQRCMFQLVLPPAADSQGG